MSLVGTHFYVSSGFAAGGPGSGAASDSVAITNAGQKIVLKGGGFCGWFTGVGFPNNPFNQNGSTIQLMYE
jgi:hypothetical protein